MLKELYSSRIGINKVVLAVGTTDLRSGIDRLAAIIKMNYHLDPFEKGVLFLFCGKRSDRIKGLIWDGCGFVLLYVRLEGGSFTWPRGENDVAVLNKEQYKLLLQGYHPLKPKVYEIGAPRKVM